MTRDEAIEAMARAFYEWTVGGSHADFVDLVGTAQDYWRSAATHVLDAVGWREPVGYVVGTKSLLADGVPWLPSQEATCALNREAGVYRGRYALIPVDPA